MEIFNKRYSSVKMVIKNFFICGIIIFIAVSGCSTAIKKNGKDLKITDEENISHLLKLIERFNTNSPQSFISNFNVEGHSGNQKFRTTGNAQYNNNPRKMKIVFHDAVFQSSITEIIQEGDILKLYFPLPDKVLYIENINKIDLKLYTNFNLDFNLISDLSTGKIPLIKHYSVYKGLESGTDPVIEGNKLIILENEEYYETISFLDDVPDKILWVDKNTKERIEVYLKKPVFKDNFLFYKEAKIISRNADLNIVIQFSSIKFNIPVDLDNITKIKIPKDAKVIKRD